MRTKSSSYLLLAAYKFRIKNDAANTEFAFIKEEFPANPATTYYTTFSYPS